MEAFKSFNLQKTWVYNAIILIAGINLTTLSAMGIMIGIEKYQEISQLEIEHQKMINDSELILELVEDLDSIDLKNIIDNKITSAEELKQLVSDSYQPIQEELKSSKGYDKYTDNFLFKLNNQPQSLSTIEVYYFHKKMYLKTQKRMTVDRQQIKKDKELKLANLSVIFLACLTFIFGGWKTLTLIKK